MIRHAYGGVRVLDQRNQDCLCITDLYGLPKLSVCLTEFRSCDYELLLAIIPDVPTRKIAQPTEHIVRARIY